MLTVQEMAELEALETELNPQRQPAAPTRSPGDLNTPNIQVLTPEEEAELVALEQEFSPRQFEAPGQVEERGYLTQIGDAVDSYTGAPIRKAIGTLQDTNSLAQSASALVDQFGEDPSLAPTGKEIATKAGFSTENAQIKLSPREIEERERPFNGRKKVGPTVEVYSPAGVAGLAIDVGADWTNLLPFIPAGKIAGKAGRSFNTALKGSAKAADAALGTPFVKTGDALMSAGKASVETVQNAKVSLSKIFKPDMAPDFNDLTRIAAENNIDPKLFNEAIEFGENSVISRHARSVAEGPLGGKALEKHDELLNAVSQATESNIAKIGNVTSIADDVEAGSIIRNSFDEGVDNFFKSMGETYGNALKLAPDMRLDPKSSKIVSSKLNEMEMWAKKRLGSTAGTERVINSGASSVKQVNQATGEMLDVLGSTNKAITKGEMSQAREVLEAVRIAKNAVNTSGGDLNQVYSAMRDIGNVAFKSKNTLAELPSDVRKFQEMYFTLQKGATESIRTGLGDEFANALVENNKAMSNFFSQRSQVANIIGNKNLADEKVFQSLVMNGDSKKLDALFSIISPEAKSQLKASFLNKTLIRNADGVINFASSRKKLNGLKVSGKLKNILSVDEMKQLDDILKLGDRSGVGVLSTSGTGGSNSFRNIATTLQDKIAGDTLIDNLKNRTRSNYVEVPSKTASGKDFLQRVKAPEAAKSKSGISLLKEKVSVKPGQAQKGAQVNSAIERNERLEKYKQMRGIK